MSGKQRMYLSVGIVSSLLVLFWTYFGWKFSSGSNLVVCVAFAVIASVFVKMAIVQWLSTKKTVSVWFIIGIVLFGAILPIVAIAMGEDTASASVGPVVSGPTSGTAGATVPAAPPVEEFKITGTVREIGSEFSGSTVAGEADLMALLPPETPMAEPDKQSFLSIKMPLSGKANILMLDGASVDPMTSGDALVSMAKAGVGKPFAYVKNIRQFPFYDLPHNPSNLMLILYAGTDSQQPIDFTYSQRLTGVQQWVVTVGGPEAASFKIPASGWSSIWVVPVLNKRWWAQWGGSAVPPEGLAGDEIKDRLTSQLVALGKDPAAIRAELAKFKTLLETAPFSGSALQYFSLYWAQDGGDGQSYFPKGHKLWRASDSSCHGKTITVGTRIPGVMPLGKPFEVVIGIKQ